MAAAVANLSTGPTLARQQQGVHIIFVPPDVQPDPPPDVSATQSQLDAIAAWAGDIAVTDVVVFARQPWHKVHGHLREHPQVHVTFPQTVVKLLIERGESAVWWSEHHFEITKIEPHDHGQSASAAIPNPFPLPPTVPDRDPSGRPIHVAKSEVPIEASKNHEYKITFTRSGQTIDPNMRCI